MALTEKRVKFVGIVVEGGGCWLSRMRMRCWAMVIRVRVGGFCRLM